MPICSANPTHLLQWPPKHHLRTLGLQDTQLTKQCLEIFQVTLSGEISGQFIDNKLSSWVEVKSGVLETEREHQKEKMKGYKHGLC